MDVWVWKIRNATSTFFHVSDFVQIQKIFFPFENFKVLGKKKSDWCVCLNLKNVLSRNIEVLKVLPGGASPGSYLRYSTYSTGVGEEVCTPPLFFPGIADDTVWSSVFKRFKILVFALDLSRQWDPWRRLVPSDADSPRPSKCSPPTPQSSTQKIAMDHFSRNKHSFSSVNLHIFLHSPIFPFHDSSSQNFSHIKVN